MAVSIRPATVDDAPGIARVHVASWHTTYTGIVPDDVIASLTVERREQQWRRDIPASGSIVHVAEDEAGQILGFISGGAQREGSSEYTGELYAIYLLQSTQRSGTGRRLVTALAQDLVAQGHHSMLVWVLKDNPVGRQFYEKLGGLYVSEKSYSGDLIEVSYGWKNIRPLAQASE